MEFETLIKFLMDWQGCTREQAVHYINLRDMGYNHSPSLQVSTGKLVEDYIPNIWNVTVEEKSSLG